VDLFIGELLAARAARVSEFEADAAAARWGYAQALVEALEAAGDGGEPNNLPARLRADHPPLRERIERLRGLSVPIEAGGRR
jgi:Zn-dependent protease with chaperone function